MVNYTLKIQMMVIGFVAENNGGSVNLYYDGNINFI